VIVVQSCLESRLCLASQVLKVMAELGFTNPNSGPAWDKIILCGTHVDCAKTKHKQAFKDVGIKFFTDPVYNPKGEGTVVLCGDDPDDSNFASEPYQPLVDAMARIAATGQCMECKEVSAHRLAVRLSAVMGVDVAKFKLELRKHRHAAVKGNALCCAKVVHVAVAQGAKQGAEQASKQTSKQFLKAVESTASPWFLVADAAQTGADVACAHFEAPPAVQAVVPRVVGVGGYAATGFLLGGPAGAAAGTAAWAVFEVLGEAVYQGGKAVCNFRA